MKMEAKLKKHIDAYKLNNKEMKKAAIVPKAKRKALSMVRSAAVGIIKKKKDEQFNHQAIDHSDEISSSFFNFIKNNAHSGVTSETTLENKVFYEYFKESYFRQGSTPVPPFAFINNGALTINQYVLSDG